MRPLPNSEKSANYILQEDGFSQVVVSNWICGVSSSSGFQSKVQGCTGQGQQPQSTWEPVPPINQLWLSFIYTNDLSKGFTQKYTHCYPNHTLHVLSQRVRANQSQAQGIRWQHQRALEIMCCVPLAFMWLLNHSEAVIKFVNTLLSVLCANWLFEASLENVVCSSQTLDFIFLYILSEFWDPSYIDIIFKRKASVTCLRGCGSVL